MKLRKLLTVISFLLFTAIISCKKTDVQQTSNSNNNEIEKRFFAVPENAGPQLKQLIETIKKQNDKIHFVENLVKENGYPLWDKAFSNLPNGGLSPDGAGNAGFFVPFRKDNSPDITAYITALLGSDTTLLKLFNKEYYLNKTRKEQDSAKRSKYLRDLAIFGYFEKHINRKDTLYLPGTVQPRIYNVNLSYQRSSTNGRGQYLECTGYYAECYDSDGGGGSGGGGGGVVRQAKMEDWWCWEIFYGCTEVNETLYYFLDDGGGGGGGWYDTGGGGPNPGGGGGGGSNPYAAISSQLDNILAPGDSYYFDNNLDPNQSLYFQTVANFQNYLASNANNQHADLTSPADIIDPNNKIEHGKFNLTFIGGVDISTKLEKTGTTWTLSDVTSTEYGVTLGWSWDQSSFSQSTSGNEITVVVEGYVKYNVIIESFGTVYKQFYKFQIKINNQTGKITALAKL